MRDWDTLARISVVVSATLVVLAVIVSIVYPAVNAGAKAIGGMSDSMSVVTASAFKELDGVCVDKSGAKAIIRMFYGDADMTVSFGALGLPGINLSADAEPELLEAFVRNVADGAYDVTATKLETVPTIGFTRR